VVPLQALQPLQANCQKKKKRKKKGAIHSIARALPNRTAVLSLQYL
jgi:hypothetical protein